MTERAYDRDFLPLLSELPSVQDFSSAEKIHAIREMRASIAPPPFNSEDVVIRDEMIAGYQGAPDVQIRIYRPKQDVTSPRPALLEIHGGGFILGNIEMMDAWCQAMAIEIDAVIVSVGYRLAPEAPFPAGLHDCYAALVWLKENASDLTIDPNRIAIAGQSAGGGLAAGLALFARDQGGPNICFQLLEIPELDDRLDTPSMLSFQDTPFWNRPNAVWSWKHYLGPNHSGETSIYAAPARARDLAGLPPTYISTMEFDPLRDEGLRYGMALLEAGISVELHSYSGTFHGSAFFPQAEPTRRNTAEIIAILRRRLHPE